MSPLLGGMAEGLGDKMKMSLSLVERGFEEMSFGDGAKLVQGAFTTLLGRSAEPDALAYYTGRLAKGVTRPELVGTILLSAEGRDFFSQVYDYIETLESIARVKDDTERLTRIVDEFGALDDASVRLAVETARKWLAAGDLARAEAMYLLALGGGARDPDLMAFLGKYERLENSLRHLLRRLWPECSVSFLHPNEPRPPLNFARLMHEFFDLETRDRCSAAARSDLQSVAGGVA